MNTSILEVGHIFHFSARESKSTVALDCNNLLATRFSFSSFRLQKVVRRISCNGKGESEAHGRNSTGIQFVWESSVLKVGQKISVELAP